jgi:hypothetical protein
LAARRAALARVRERTRTYQFGNPIRATATLTRLCPFPERPYDDDPAPHTLAGRRRTRRHRRRGPGVKTCPGSRPEATGQSADGAPRSPTNAPSGDNGATAGGAAIGDAAPTDGGKPSHMAAGDTNSDNRNSGDSKPAKTDAATDKAHAAESGKVVDGTTPADNSRHQSGAQALLTAGLAEGELIDLIQTTQRLIGYVTGVQARAMSALAQRSEPINGHDQGFRGHDDISSFVEDEVSLACGISRQSGSNRIEVALALTERLPKTLRALELGDIDFVKARIMAYETDPLTAPQAASVEDVVVDELTGPGKVCSYRRWEIRIREAVAAVDPKTSEERREKAKTTRSLEYTAEADGMACLAACLPAPAAQSIYALVTRHALANPGDDRTLAQRRADAFIDLILGQATSSARKPLINVTVAASTLLGLDSQPAQLDGYGPITAEMARELAADGTWRRLLTDPKSGALLDYGRRLYRPPAAMARHIRALHQVCRFPGCDRPAEFCDLDHRIAFPDGPTSEANLRPLCRHHHRAKGNTPWYDETLPDGTVLWISPTGHGWIDPLLRVQPKQPTPAPEPPKEDASKEEASKPEPTDDPPPF